MQEPVQIVRSDADLRALLPQLLAARGIPQGLDSETSGPTIVWRGKKRPDPYRARLTGFSFSLRDANWYVPVAHRLDADGLPATNVSADAAREFIQALLDAIETHELTVVCHNLKYDLQVFKNFGVRIPAFSDKLYCSQVAAWLAGWGSDHKSLALKKLAVRLGLGAGDTFDEVAKGRQAEDIPVNEIAPYAGRDAWLAAAVLKRAWERLEQLDLTRHYREIDMPQIEILRGAEEAGNAVNATLLRELEQKLTTEAEALKAEFYAKTEWIVDMPVKRRVPTGELFKNGKPKLKTIEVPEPTLLGADVSNDGQVSRWMYEELELWPRKGLEKNGANHYPVDKETIEKFCALPGAAGELARIRLEYGLRSKLISTYIAPLLGLPPQYGDGRLHTSYNVTGTVTQRLSSSGPNLQNLPSRTKEGKLIREALIADAGWKIIVFDYSQIELRICAHISQDEEMMACYVLGEDVHQGTLDGMRKEWPGAQRTDAKVTNFCVTPSTKILRADLSWCRADEVVVGDQLVGFDEKLGRHARYKPTAVEHVQFVRQPTYRVTTTHGVLECSASHAWVVREPRRWVETKDLRPGDKVAFISSPWNRTADSWLSGMFDGEGSVSAQGQVGVAQNDGPTLDRLRRELDRVGLEYTESPSKKSSCIQLLMRNGSGLRAIGQLAPSRLLPKYQQHLFGSRCTHPHADDVSVVSVEYVGDQLLVGHRTSERTLITNGFLTHNSTIYRISAPSLAVKMRTTEDKAEASIEAFYNRFQRVAVYHRQAIAYAAKHGYARTIDGFKRQLDTTPKFNRRSRKMEMSWAVQNEAINTPIQGSAGGLIKIAMRDAHRVWVAKGVYGTKVRFVGQEHDSAIATAVDDFVAEASADLEHAMVNAWKLRVPLAAEGGSGNNWSEAKG